MRNQPHSARNPALPADAAAAKNTRDGLPKAEGELDKTEAEKEQETSPEDKKPFDVDKADEVKADNEDK
ncbi:hypothetical protein AB4027_05245 [Alkalibacterium putridalgicola]|uniref:hypothetical protein n=1 Tax=Alkalibacterium putridalgicola TaxID=426703 RepID=UPI0034D017C1